MLASTSLPPTQTFPTHFADYHRLKKSKRQSLFQSCHGTEGKEEGLGSGKSRSLSSGMNLWPQTIHIPPLSLRFFGCKWEQGPDLTGHARMKRDHSRWGLIHSSITSLLLTECLFVTRERRRYQRVKRNKKTFKSKTFSIPNL